MAEWTLKRFWNDVTVAEDVDGPTVHLDGRPLRTPAKSSLVLPSAALAEAVAEEWRQQQEFVRPSDMPMTRLANTTLDRVRPEFDAVAAIVASYGETDLLCYRAEGPAELVRRQGEAWDPLLDWAEERLGARLSVTQGVIPITQSSEALRRLGDKIRTGSPWRLTALHDLVSLTGSLVIGLAVEEAVRSPETAWALSRLDEDWQAELWGRDAEAEAAAERRWGEFMDAVRFLRLSSTVT